MKFLVIEDNSVDSDLLKRYILKKFPMAQITVCNKFMPGIKSLYHENHDAIFLDLNLPDNWGISTVRDIKKYSKKIPIFVTTGFTNPITNMEATKAGASTVMAKSDITAESIFSAVNAYHYVA
jgi:two-component system cell cycle response regulator